MPWRGRAGCAAVTGSGAFAPGMRMVLRIHPVFTRGVSTGARSSSPPRGGGNNSGAERPGAAQGATEHENESFGGMDAGGDGRRGDGAADPYDSADSAAADTAEHDARYATGYPAEHDPTGARLEPARHAGPEPAGDG